MSELLSDCCGEPADGHEDVGICPRCKEHCSFEPEHNKPEPTEHDKLAITRHLSRQNGESEPEGTTNSQEISNKLVGEQIQVGSKMETGNWKLIGQCADLVQEKAELESEIERLNEEVMDLRKRMAGLDEELADAKITQDLSRKLPSKRDKTESKKEGE